MPTEVRFYQGYVRIVFADGTVHEVLAGYRQIGTTGFGVTIIGSDRSGPFVASFPTQAGLPPDCYRENAVGIERGQYIEAEGVLWSKAPTFTSAIHPDVGSAYPAGTRFCFNSHGLITTVIGPGSGATLPTVGGGPSPLTADPATAKARSIVASVTTPSYPPAAAAFVTTTYAAYASSLPDTAGIQGAPSPSDVVILVEIEGYFPASHSCFFPMGACYDTGIFVAFDQTLDQTLGVTYEDDPWSRDRPSPGPSVSERFGLLRHLGTPVTLQLP